MTKHIYIYILISIFIKNRHIFNMKIDKNVFYSKSLSFLSC